MGSSAQVAGGKGGALEALRFYDCIVDKDSQTESNIGAARHALGHFKSAVAALRKAAVLAPEDHEVMYNLGIAHAASGNLHEAVTCLERALSLHFTEPRYHEMIAPMLLRVRNNEDRAMRHYRVALKLRKSRKTLHSLATLMHQAGSASAPMLFAQAQNSMQDQVEFQCSDGGNAAPILSDSLKVGRLENGVIYIASDGASIFSEKPQCLSLLATPQSWIHRYNSIENTKRYAYEMVLSILPLDNIRNYYLHLAEALPRLLWLRASNFPVTRKLRLLVPPVEESSTLGGMLATLGIEWAGSSANVIEARPNSVISFKKLFLPLHRSSADEGHRLRLVKRFMLGFPLHPRAPQEPYAVLVRRSKSRRLVGIHILENAIRNRLGLRHYWGNETFLETLTMLGHSASCLVGAHGAGLVNALMMRRQTARLVEIGARQSLPYFSNIAENEERKRNLYI